MLTSADAELAERDSRLPGLALLLDTDAFAAKLRREWPERDLRGATSGYVRYKPGTNCLVAYRVEADGSTLDVHAKAYRPERFAGIRAAPSGGGRLALEEAAVLVFVFPEDDRIGALARLGDAAGRDALLRKLLPARPDAWQGRLVTLRYKPERRYVAQVAAGEGTRMLMKAYAGEEFDTAQSNARALRSRGPLRLARRLGRSRRHRILVLEWLPGGLLREAMRDPEFEPARLAAVGAALAELHRQPPDRLRVQARARDAASWTSAASGIGLLCPRLARRATDLARRLAADLTDGSPVHRAIHGDFDASQVVLDEGSAGFLDLDQAAIGDPEADFGGFLARMERDALHRRLPAGRVGALLESLLEGYRAAAGEASPERIALFTAGNLLQLSPDAFRLREAEWPDRIAETLARAEAVLAQRTD